VESLSFEAIMEGYTQNISNPNDSDWTRINVSCSIMNQQFVSGRRLNSDTSSVRRRRLDDVGGDTDAPTAAPDLPNNFVDYTMSWASLHVNVTNYSDLFFAFINSNLDSLTSDLQANGLNISLSTRARIIKTTEPPSFTPTVSWFPSTAPSLIPTASPSLIPSGNPSLLPTPFPTVTPTIAPSMNPSDSTIVPDSPSTNSGGGANTTIIVVVVVGLLLAGLVGSYIFFTRRKARRELAYQTAAAAGGSADRERGSDRFSSSRLNIKTDLYGGMRDGHSGGTPRSDDQAAGMISPSESLLSNQSLLSAGASMGVESIEENDGTHNLADEFDQYKDQNLEKMRTDVEETVTGADGMMSHALTLALMSDEDPDPNQRELYWGGSGDPTEIEASALCEVNDFLKRKDGAGLAERYVVI
jgi:hypothetical protein